jgi:hypothetical protein
LTSCKGIPIVYNESCGPIFGIGSGNLFGGGGNDILISDKSNVNSSSYAKISSCFRNSNYSFHNSDIYKRFTGSPN